MRYLIIACITLVFSSCKNDHESFRIANQKAKTVMTGVEYMEDEQGIMEMDQAPMSLQNPLPPSSKKEQIIKIIKTGNLSFDVDDINSSKSKVDQFLQSVNGYYEDERYNSSRKRNTYYLSIKVPSQDFDSLVYLLESGTGKLTSKSISAQDVSEEYVDLQIRLKNNLAYLNQYKEILKRATTIKEILKVQEHIRNLEMEIESKKGQLQFLDNRVSYGTLNVEISKEIDFVDDSRSFTKRIGNAFKNGYEAFLSFIVVLVNLWPFIVLLIAIIIFRRRIIGLFRRNKS